MSQDFYLAANTAVRPWPSLADRGSAEIRTQLANEGTEYLFRTR